MVLCDFNLYKISSITYFHYLQLSYLLVKDTQMNFSTNIFLILFRTTLSFFFFFLILIPFYKK